MQKKIENKMLVTEVKISVIIPTHNREELLERALKSVLAQTFNPFEVIIADDGSTDGTSAKVRGWMQLDERLQYFRSEKNIGAAAVRNRALVLAKGEYVCFLDDDDEWEPRKLAIQYELGPISPLVGCLSKRVDGYKVLGVSVSRQEPSEISNEFVVSDVTLEDVFFDNGGLSPSNVMIKKECLAGVGGFDESLVASQGRDLFVRIIHKYGEAKLVHLQLTKHYQVHGGSRISDSKNHVIGGWMEFRKNGHLMSPRVYNWRLTALYLKEYRFSDNVKFKVYWFIKALAHVRIWRLKAYIKMFVRYLIVR